MVKYITKKSGTIYIVNIEGIFRNGKKLENLTLVGGIPSNTKPERIDTSSEIIFRLKIREHLKVGDYLLFLPILDKGKGWRRINPDYIEITQEYASRHIHKFRSSQIETIIENENPFPEPNPFSKFPK